jgi:transposase InsO family protein
MELGIQPVFSDPAHPEQNGRHERMHRELKGEATRPPGNNIQLQQRKFNKFRKEYNEIRPHEALEMKTPAMVHTFSKNRYLEVIPEWS